MLAAGDTCDGVRDEDDKRPEEARNLRERASEGLDRERRGVGVGYVVSAAGEILERHWGGRRKKAYTTENARRKRINLPPPFHGERTWLRSPPVPPFVNASVYAGF